MNGEMKINVNGVDIILEFEASEFGLLNVIMNKLNEEFKEEGADKNASKN